MSMVCNCDCEPISENYTYNKYNYNSMPMPVSYDENDDNIVKCLAGKGINSNFNGRNPQCNDQCVASGCTDVNSVCTDYCSTDMSGGGGGQPPVDIDPETCKVYADILQNKSASCDSIQDINARERCKSDLYELMHNMGSDHRCDAYLNKPVNPVKPIPAPHKKPVKPQPKPQPVNPPLNSSGFFNTTGGKIVIGVSVILLIAIIVFLFVSFRKPNKRQNLRFY